MYSSQEWWSNAGGGGDPGDPIHQSLRFRNSGQFLQRSVTTDSSSNTYTFSAWYKPGNTGAYLLTCTDGTICEHLGIGTNAQFRYNPSATNDTTAQFRDPSAWYHVVITWDNPNYSIFVNGVRQAVQNNTPAEIDINNLGGNVYLFATKTGSAYGDGYMADVYFIDGQALEPTVFGRYNDEGVWVPVRPEGLTFGSNGFYLDFSDPNDIGADRSPNGNDFTPTGFNTTLPGLFSDQVFSSDSTTIDWDTTSRAGFSTTDSGGFGRAQMFDGNAASAAGSNGQVDDQNYVAIWRPAYPIEVSTLRIAPNSSSASARFNVYVNGDSATSLAELTGDSVTTWQDVPFTGQLSSIFVGPSTTTADNSGWQGIEINGNVLVDNTGTDYDHMEDSPTQNYATMNPLVTYEGQIGEFGGNRSTAERGAADGNLSLSGLSATGGGQKYGISTIAAKGKVYIELTRGSVVNGGQAIALFVGDQPRQSQTYYGDPKVYTFNDDGAVRQGDGSLNGTTLIADYPSLAAGDIASIALDMDNGNAWFAINGVWQQGNPAAGTNPTLTNLNAEQDYAFLGISCGDTADNPNINYGQQPFRHTPPDGYSALQTQNLPIPPILNGREQFQALTNGPGAGKIYRQGEIDITAAFVEDPSEEVSWRDSSLIDYVGVVTLDGGQVFDNLTIWSVSTGSGLQIYISEDGTTWTDTGSTSLGTGIQTYSGPARYIRYGKGGSTWQADYFVGVGTIDIIGLAQQTFPYGLWWIKDRVNSNQHQLVDSVRGGNLAFTCPGGKTANYAAPAGDSVAWCWNYDAAGPAQNGFEIITYTGDGGTQNIPHRLGGVPDFFITFRTGDTANFRTPWVWHGSAPVANQRLQLNDPVAGSTITNFWGQPTATDLVMGPGDNTNASGFDHLVYLWRAVPGYSAFGTYTANGTTDNAFCYCGFRPAVVIIKRFNGTGDWSIIDTTRDINNPVINQLRPNLAEPERQYDSGGLDILSNGFKIRQGGSMIGDNGNQHVWAAFAENPFQSPVTAR